MGPRYFSVSIMVAESHDSLGSGKFVSQRSRTLLNLRLQGGTMDSRGTWGRSVCGHRSILSSWLVRSFFIATLLFWARIADSQPIDPDVVRFQPDLANKGAVLFNRDWQSKDPLCPDGDGLGPMFNAKSCQACHWMGNSGGAGSNRDNVSVLTWVGGKALTTPQPRNSHRLVTSRVHSAVNVNRRSTVFHHSSTDDGYDPWRKRILGPGTNSAMTVSLGHALGPCGDAIHSALNARVAFPEEA